MDSGRLIYLDHAATSFPKPLAVRRAMMDCMCRYGGNPGRGAHPLSLAAARKVYECREVLAAFCGVEDPSRVIFTQNTTHGLNFIMKGVLRSGDHVLISDLEHNAVWRPLCRLAKEGRITLDIFSGMALREDATPARICAGIAKRLRPESRMVVCTMASNICSARLPIREIAAFCHRHGLLLVVDGAQGVGHFPVRVDEMGIDALCIPGHKGLWGPQGCGAVLLGRCISPDTLTEGGNGVYSLEWDMGDTLPERYEAGTLPTPAIAGLCAGIRVLERMGLEQVEEYERMLWQRAREQLGNTKGVTLYAPNREGAVLLFNVDGMPPDRVGQRLAEEGICVRSGYHCAALAHGALQTGEGGAVRVGFGMTNRLSDVDALRQAVQKIKREG